MTNARGLLIHLGKLVKSPPQSLGEIAFGEREGKIYLYEYCVLPQCTASRQTVSLHRGESSLAMLSAVVAFMDGDKCTSLARSSVLIPAMYAAHVQSIMREGEEGRAMCGRKYCFWGFSYRAYFSVPYCPSHATYQNYHHV